MSAAAASEDAYRQDARWAAVLTAETWPEVFRRFVVTRLHAQEAPLTTLAQAQAAERLAQAPLRALEPVERLRLLLAACDEAMDTGAMRTLVEERLNKVELVRSCLLPWW